MYYYYIVIILLSHFFKYCFYCHEQRIQTHFVELNKLKLSIKLYNVYAINLIYHYHD